MKNAISPHQFHIPVMGIAYTIDSPVKVAHFGINSSISIIEDHLIEKMRAYYYKLNRQKYIPISKNEINFRAKRITDYLNLINTEVKKKVEEVKNAAFTATSDITKYFEMLPEVTELKQKYLRFTQLEDVSAKNDLEKELRGQVKPGAIEVNIMTKVDREQIGKNSEPVENGSDALQALKGYAESDLENSTLVFSAGMNPRLFNYLSSFKSFQPDSNGVFNKAIAIKVSDYRSALIQGKYLAKRGIWVSEFRIESGLNCGGHAFATDGFLLGPILEEFKEKKEELTLELKNLYQNYFSEEKVFNQLPDIKITVQGGIGTFEEDKLLKDYYKVDATGWGSPFLLCKEATNVDEETLKKLQNAKARDIVLSHSSPLGVRFNYLKGASGEDYRRLNLLKNKPGSACPEKLLQANTEFTEKPICTASHKYQKLKVAHIQQSDMSVEEKEKESKLVYQKECLCTGLCNTAAINYNFQFVKNMDFVTVCPGPNLAYFSGNYSLKELVDHIYGRKTVLSGYRPHMFIKELQLYIDYLKELRENTDFSNKREVKKYERFLQNLNKGITYYKQLFAQKTINNSEFISDLRLCEKELNMNNQKNEVA
ncbi:hypothetical protein SAMN04488096_103129 [Mesonia phycicola]|uniref:Uncharacterized protein n=1 Tax=Mesonia phycicola TaxID=579105 RepID=A0A1M6CRS0_9FLAO|nr:hypothetical protein [Mesonia phycicola]SHI63717.1 hypothetical protein SAMN04488096_103129 [Mesonia phycicola]